MTFSTSTHSLNRSLADRFLEATTRNAVAIARYVRSTSSRPVSGGVAMPVAPASDVAVIDDPEGGVRLIGVRGQFNLACVAELADAIDDGIDAELVHVDFTAADIAAEHAIESLEATFDRAERRGIRLRVVGLDPDHPALLRRTSR